MRTTTALHRTTGRLFVGSALVFSAAATGATTARDEVLA
jgi:hypothetical protein